MDLEFRLSRRFNFSNVVGGEEFYPLLFGHENYIKDVLSMHLTTPNLHWTVFHTQMSRLDAMDLATRNSVGAYWDRRTFTHLTRSLPPMTREHLLEVRRLDTGSMLHRLYMQSFVQVANTRYIHQLWGQILEPYAREMSERERTMARVQRYLRMSRRYAMGRYLIFPDVLPDIVFLDSSELTIEALQTLYNIHWTRERLFWDVMDVNSWEILIRHAKKQGFDFWGLMRGTGRLADEYNPVVDYLDNFHEHHELARVLLFHGFKYSAQKAVYESQRRGFTAVGYRIPDTITSDSYYKRIREMLSIDTFYAFERERGEEEKIVTLSQVIRSITEPHPTPQVLKDKLLSIMHPWHLDRIFRAVLRYAVYDLEDSETAPRTLQHLCRCHIREVLRSYLRLPEGLESLVREKFTRSDGTQVDRQSGTLLRYLGLQN